ncbi:MAG: hypothetical protein OXD01_05135 [Gammaproteobacteria bacterium]|nr:hypothetical protein [Gammaproteobacteria bacterium]
MTNQRIFPVIDSKGMDGQMFIEANPDSNWEIKGDLPKGVNEPPILEKAGHLLVTGGQNASSARLTAVASDIKYIGNGWIPVTGMNSDEAKASAVFINSTMGRIQMMVRCAKAFVFPQYNPNVVAALMIPDLSNSHILKILVGAWERTRHIQVPLYRDGECEVRCIWDHAVAIALDMDKSHIDKMRCLLHQEPVVSGRSFGDVVDDESVSQ